MKSKKNLCIGLLVLFSISIVQGTSQDEIKTGEWVDFTLVSCDSITLEVFNPLHIPENDDSYQLSLDIVINNISNSYLRFFNDTELLAISTTGEYHFNLLTSKIFFEQKLQGLYSLTNPLIAVISGQYRLVVSELEIDSGWTPFLLQACQPSSYSIINFGQETHDVQVKLNITEIGDTYLSLALVNEFAESSSITVEPYKTGIYESRNTARWVLLEYGLDPYSPTKNFSKVVGSFYLQDFTVSNGNDVSSLLGVDLIIALSILFYAKKRNK